MLRTARRAVDVGQRPRRADLEGLYEVLSRWALELEEAGGAEAVLRDSGVVSVSLSPIGPGPVEEADHVPDELASTPLEERLDADVLASELMVDDLGRSPQHQAETLLSRLRRVLGDPATATGSRIDTHAAVHDLMGGLLDGVRRSFVELLVDRVAQDPVAERLIGTATRI